MKTKPCHTDPCEIYPNLFVGSGSSARVMAEDGVDVLVPLAELNGNIWDTGWRGRILYYPIRDYSALPVDVLGSLVQEVTGEIKQGRKVGVFCVGGHGRTGYVCAALLGVLLPHEDPIAYVREKYCNKAIESNEQITSLAEFLGRDDLLQHTPAKSWSKWSYYGYGHDDDYYNYWKGGEYDSYGSCSATIPTDCAECFYFETAGKVVICRLGRLYLDPGTCPLGITKSAAQGLTPLCPTCKHYGQITRWCDIFQVRGIVVDCYDYDPKETTSKK